MNESRIRNSVLIMLTSGIRQFCTVILTFVSRTVFINILGAEYLGLNGLFSNILSLLSLSELGIGVAVSFYLYKPLVDKNIDRIKSIMNFYKVCYRFVGLAIILFGLILMPFLPELVNFEQNVPVNLYLVYLLYVFNTACSYFLFAYKQTLVEANQQQYKIEKINILFSFVNFFTDIVILILFRNYIMYLVFKLMLVLLKNVVLGVKIDKEYPYLKDKKYVKLEKKEVSKIFKDITSISFFRVGSTLFNSTDNIVISFLLGTVIVGYYSNYFMIISQINIVIILLIRSFTAGIGNVVAKESLDKQYELFKQIDFAVYFITTIFTACLFQLLNSFVKLWIGNINENYILSQIVVILLCISFYMDATSQIMNCFREANGYFEKGRYYQIVGGVINIILSLILGRKFGLAGIFFATIVGKASVPLFPFMIMISKDVFKKNKFELMKIYLKRACISVLICILLWFVCMKIHMNGTVLSFFIEASLSVIIPIVCMIIIFYRKKEMKHLFRTIVELKAKLSKR